MYMKCFFASDAIDNNESREREREDIKTERVVVLVAQIQARQLPAVN